MVLTEFAEPADQDPDYYQVRELNFMPVPGDDGQGGDKVRCFIFCALVSPVLCAHLKVIITCLRCQAGPTDGKQHNHQEERGVP